VATTRDGILVLDDGRRLGYADAGEPDGLPIFLLHGTPGSRVFRFENEPLVKDERLRMITPERRGYGLSDPFPERTILGFADDIRQLADELDIQKFHVAGVSGGGPYALACAAVLQNRVLSATLIASATPVDMKGFSKGMSIGNRISFAIARYLPFMLKPLYAYSVRSMIKSPEKVVDGLAPQLCAWDRKVLSELREQGVMDVFLDHIREAYRTGYSGGYTDIRLLVKPWHIDFSTLILPIFVWHGEDDTLIPVAAAKEFVQMLPGCDTHFLDGAGHLLLESDKYVGSIITALKKIESSPIGDI